MQYDAECERLKPPNSSKPGNGYALRPKGSIARPAAASRNRTMQPVRTTSTADVNRNSCSVIKNNMNAVSFMKTNSSVAKSILQLADDSEGHMAGGA